MIEYVLGEIADVKTGPFGTQLKASEYVSDGIPIINVKNIGFGNLIKDDIDYVNLLTCKRLKDHILKENDIVLGRKGSVDRHCIIRSEEEGWLQGSDCIRVRIHNTEVNPQYVSCYLMQEGVKRQLNNAAVGSTMASMNSNIIKSITMKLPPIEEQNIIADFLEKIHQKIENNNRINKELEAMAKTIYDYWFLQFEFPNEEGKPYKSSGGKMVWNEELKREIPEGWEVLGVDDLGILNNGINYDKNVQGNREYTIVNVRDISNTNIFLNVNMMSNIRLDSRMADKYLVKNNDILIARSGIPGAVRILDVEDLQVIYCGFIICFSVNSSLYKQYLLYTLQLYENTSATNSGGTVMQNVSQNTLRSLRFCVPNEKVIELFNKEILPIWDLVKKNNKENHEMISFRDFLLPILMNGQIEFKDN